MLSATRGVGRRDADDPAATLAAELHCAGDQREQRVVAATADALTGVEVRAALADDDLARVDELAPKRLTPRNCALESRPLRVEDAPFLCAMSVPAFC